MGEGAPHYERRGLKLPKGVELNRGNREAALEKYPGPQLSLEGSERVLEDQIEKDPNTINIVVLLGGGDRPQGGGIALAMQENGIVGSVDYIYAASVGTAVASHLITGEADKSKRMFRAMTTNELLVKRFKKVPYALKQDNLNKIIEGELGSLRVAREKESGSPELIAAVTDKGTGELEFFEAKRHPQAMQIRLASANAPTPNLLKGVEVEGRVKTDGMIANSLPIEEMVNDARRRIQASGRTEPYRLSVCIVMNTQEAKAKYGESLAMKMYMSATHPKPTADKVWRGQEIFNRELEWVRERIEEGKKDETKDQYLLAWSAHHPELLKINQAESKILFEGAQSDFSDALKNAKDRLTKGS